MCEISLHAAASSLLSIFILTNCILYSSLVNHRYYIKRDWKLRGRITVLYCIELTRDVVTPAHPANIFLLMRAHLKPVIQAILSYTSLPVD